MPSASLFSAFRILLTISIFHIAIAFVATKPRTFTTRTFTSSLLTLNKMAPSSDDTAIRTLLSTYESSLNKSDPDLAASCYTADGVFFPTGLPTATGTEGLKASYAAIFENIQLNVEFTIDELVVSSDTSAYALTQSAGHVIIKATGDNPAEANREIFIFQKVGGDDWKIARYMFNKSQ